MSNELTLQQAQDMLPTAAARGTFEDRTIATIKAQVFMAKQFPRDENAARIKVLRACQRPGLAAKAFYSYPKGGKNVTGPSIRLAEELAKAWGSIDFNIATVETRATETEALAYCWDLENNTRVSRSFIVPHKISTKNGEKILTDPRDIREQVLNQGARYLRSCLLAVIPGDLLDEAIEECNKTLQGVNRRPLIDRLRDMADLFQTRFSVPLSSIEKYFGYPMDVFTEQDGITLANIFNALKDGEVKRDDYFQLPKLAGGEDDATPEKTAEGPKKGKKKQVSMGDL